MYISANCAFCSALVVRTQQAASANVKVHFCNSACKANYQRLAKPVTREWLEDQYVVKGMDCTQIGAMVKRDPKSVWNWLRDFGIPTRPRGGHNKLPEDQRKRYVPKPKPKTPRLTTDPGEELLRVLYLGKLMSARKIAETLNLNAKTIIHWLKHHGIRIRTVRECRLIDGRVPYLKNGVHYLKGGKPENHPSWKGGITPERQAFYATQEWKDCVKMVWARDDAKCHRCGLDHRTLLRGTIRFELHHVDGFSIVESRSDPRNVILLCDRCHLWVHSKKNKRKVFLGKGH